MTNPLITINLLKLLSIIELIATEEKKTKHIESS